MTSGIRNETQHDLSIMVDFINNMDKNSQEVQEN